MPLTGAYYGFFGEDLHTASRPEEVTFDRAYAFVCPGCLHAWGYRYNSAIVYPFDQWVIITRWCDDCVPHADRSYRIHEQGSLLIANDLLCDVKELPRELCIQELINYDNCSRARQLRQGNHPVPPVLANPFSRTDHLERREAVRADVREARS